MSWQTKRLNNGTLESLAWIQMNPPVVCVVQKHTSQREDVIETFSSVSLKFLYIRSEWRHLAIFKNFLKLSKSDDGRCLFPMFNHPAGNKQRNRITTDSFQLHLYPHFLYKNSSQSLVKSNVIQLSILNGCSAQEINHGQLENLTFFKTFLFTIGNGGDDKVFMWKREGDKQEMILWMALKYIEIVAAYLWKS